MDFIMSWDQKGKGIEYKAFLSKNDIDILGFKNTTGIIKVKCENYTKVNNYYLLIDPIKIKILNIMDFIDKDGFFQILHSLRETNKIEEYYLFASKGSKYLSLPQIKILNDFVKAEEQYFQASQALKTI